MHYSSNTWKELIHGHKHWIGKSFEEAGLSSLKFEMKQLGVKGLV